MRRPLLLIVLIGAVLCAGAARAHHILGIPHYDYDERYPQVPILTYRVNAGPLEVKMTGYPGQPEPGQQVFLNVYLQNLADGSLFDGEVTLEVLRDRMFGADPVIYGPAVATREEAVFKFFPRFPEEANYTIRILYEAEGAPWTIDLPMVVGEPGSPWLVLIAVAGGMVVFLVGIRAARIKLRRREATADRRLDP